MISGNTIMNARLIGIKLDNDWSNSVISRNTVTRTAGFWPDDSTIFFAGVHQSPAPGPGVIDSNTTILDSTTWPYGFWFGGVRLNSPMPGSSITNNVVRSLTATPLGSGILDNTVDTRERDCTDAALVHCGESRSRPILRKIEISLDR